MSAPVEQPGRRFFLGELFVFIVFFAGVMSLLIGLAKLPVLFSCILVAVSALFSGAIFLWLIFTTPSRRAEPRYGFIVLSLLPSFAISPATYFALGNIPVLREITMPPVRVPMIEIVRDGPNSVQLGGKHPIYPASKLFEDEIAALDEELGKLGFVDTGFITLDTKIFTRGEPDAIAVETSLRYEVSNLGAPGRYTFLAVISNFNPRSNIVYFSAGQGKPRELLETLKARWQTNVSARVKAKEQSQ